MKTMDIIGLVALLVLGLFVVTQLKKGEKNSETAKDTISPNNFDLLDTKAFNKMRSLLTPGKIPIDDIVSRAYSAGRYTIDDRPSKALALLSEIKKLGASIPSTLTSEMTGYFNEFKTEYYSQQINAL